MAAQNRDEEDFPVPSNERERLAALLDLQILDTAPDERFDRIVRLASEHFGMPVCRLTFVDKDRNWFKASCGMNVTQAPRSIAICSHAIMEDRVLVVPDLAADARFARSPQVSGGPKFRFYAGAPIRVDNNLPVGSLCIMDTQPHPEFSARDAEFLKDLAAIVTHELELHKRSREQIQVLLDFDTLTGVHSRDYMQDAIRKALHRAADKGSTIALLSIDLDGFKAINDSKGHLQGDRVLREVGSRLSAFSGKHVSVGRLSGDEFVVLMTDYETTSQVSELAHSICHYLSLPYRLEEDVRDLTASIGIAIGPTDDQKSESLIHFSDLALYEMKSAGGNGYRYFEDIMYSTARNRLELATGLKYSAQKNELLLHYQPLVHLESGKVAGYEALVRWQHDSRGLVPPDQFINIAEETGHICEIGEWVLRTACQFATTWSPDEFVSVNLSAVQFRQQDVVAMVEAILRETNLPPERLELEVTESVLIENSDAVASALTTLTDIGVSIALDDFGTGFSSLNYLTTFPFKKIKIDKSFTDKVGINSEVSAIVEMIIQLGRTLGTAIVAEGIEDRTQHDLLRRAGCDFGQGFFYGKPQQTLICDLSQSLARSA